MTCTHDNNVIDNTSYARCLDCGARYERVGETWQWVEDLAFRALYIDKRTAPPIAR